MTPRARLFSRYSRKWPSTSRWEAGSGLHRTCGFDSDLTLMQHWFNHVFSFFLQYFQESPILTQQYTDTIGKVDDMVINRLVVGIAHFSTNRSPAVAPLLKRKENERAGVCRIRASLRWWMGDDGWRSPNTGAASCATCSFTGLRRLQHRSASVRSCWTWQRWSSSSTMFNHIQPTSNSHVLWRKTCFQNRSDLLTTMFHTSNQPLKLGRPGMPKRGPEPCVTSLGGRSCASGETSWTQNSAGPADVLDVCTTKKRLVDLAADGWYLLYQNDINEYLICCGRRCITTKYCGVWVKSFAWFWPIATWPRGADHLEASLCLKLHKVLWFGHFWTFFQKIFWTWSDCPWSSCYEQLPGQTQNHNDSREETVQLQSHPTQETFPPYKGPPGRPGKYPPYRCDLAGICRFRHLLVFLEICQLTNPSWHYSVTEKHSWHMLLWSLEVWRGMETEKSSG